MGKKSPKQVQINLNSIEQIQSKQSITTWIPTQNTLYGKILIGIVSIIIIGGTIATIITPFIIATNTFIEKTSTTTSTTSTATTSTTSTVTTSTSSTTTTSTSSTTTTTPRYPISCFSTVTASNFDSGTGTSTAQGNGLVDRPNTSGGTIFNSGGYAPQYVQLELPGFYNITSICLLIAQSPSGQTRHQISIGSNLTSLQIITDLTSITNGNQWINLTYNPILTNIKFIKLNTILSPSWIAWIKFIVYDF